MGRRTHSRTPGPRRPPGWAALLFAAASASCGGAESRRPNVLWIVLDTVRADRMSLYGYAQPTTPFLEQWAEESLVFEDCASTAGITLSAHGSMFTGLLPSEHGANNDHAYLDDSHTTVAETFAQAGYGTFLWASNPFISKDHNFAQGFQVERHPWDEHNAERARAALRAKLDPSDASSERPEQIRSGQLPKWGYHAAGSLARNNLAAWLDERGEQPWFAFLNYMEAHRPLLPGRRFRERMMTPEELERSYALDLGGDRRWRYAFGLLEYEAEELALLGATYDAALAELDELLRVLLEELESRGDLEHTIVAITADHGEHLGEHHLLDHQYSIFEELLRVPLVLRFPGRVSPGRAARPVVNFDLYPTLFELADLSPPPGAPSRARSLLAPGPDRRERLGEYVASFPGPIRRVGELYPDWDPAPYERSLRSLVEGRWKLIWASDGRHALYDLEADPEEQHDLAESQPEELDRLLARLEQELERSAPYEASGQRPGVTAQQIERLEAVGYGGE